MAAFRREPAAGVGRRQRRLRHRRWLRRALGIAAFPADGCDRHCRRGVCAARRSAAGVAVTARGLLFVPFRDSTRVLRRRAHVGRDRRRGSRRRRAPPGLPQSTLLRSSGARNLTCPNEAANPTKSRYMYQPEAKNRATTASRHGNWVSRFKDL